MFRTVTIEDDRGVAVALFDERDARREDKDAVVEAMKAGQLWGANLTALDVAALVGGFVAMVAAFLVCEYFLGSVFTSTTVKWGVFIGVAFVATSWVEGVRRRGASKRVRAALLKIGRCASCGYSLEGLKVEGDGCVVCAECGGAWGRGDAWPVIDPGQREPLSGGKLQRNRRDARSV